MNIWVCQPVRQKAGPPRKGCTTKAALSTSKVWQDLSRVSLLDMSGSTQVKAQAFNPADCQATSVCARCCIPALVTLHIVLTARLGKSVVKDV